MRQFSKKVAVLGLLSASSCGLAQAQSPWRWPSDSPQSSVQQSTAAPHRATHQTSPPVAVGSLWERLSASTPASQALIGPSDFQFPESATHRRTNSLTTEVNWDSIQATAPAGAQPQIALPRDESYEEHGSAPAAWQWQPEATSQEPIWSSAALGMVGPMDQVAPTLMQTASGTSTVAKPLRTETLNTETLDTEALNTEALNTEALNTETLNTETLVPQSPSSLIIAADFPQPGTEQVTPIPFPVASRTEVSPQREPQSEHPLIAVSLLPMHAVGVAMKEPEPVLAEVVSSGVSGQQQLVLQSVRGPSNIAQPETIVPIDIIPFSRLVRPKSQLEGVARTYNAASMTGPLNDPASLFTKLHVEDDFRQQAFVPATDVRLSTDSFSAGSEWMQQGYAWVTPTFYHRPLYFEQPNLERYGLGPKRWLQPVHSAAHFFGSIGAMPYKLLTQHPGEHVYTLGNNRPGDCVPVQRRTLLGQSYPLEALRYFDNYSGYN